MILRRQWKFFSLLLVTSLVLVIFTYSILNRQIPSVKIQPLTSSEKIAQLSECQPSFAYLNDRGRMGNQFFEYLSACLFAEALKLPLSVNPKLLSLFQKYFDSFQAQTLDLKHLENNCSIFSANISQVHMKDLDQLNKEKHPGRFVKLLGNSEFLAFLHKTF